MSEEADFLRALRKRINRRLCGIEGHNWERLEIETGLVSNASDVKRCKRCGDRKLAGFLGSSTASRSSNVTMVWDDE